MPYIKYCSKSFLFLLIQASWNPMASGGARQGGLEAGTIIIVFFQMRNWRQEEAGNLTKVIKTGSSRARILTESV